MAAPVDDDAWLYGNNVESEGQITDNDGKSRKQAGEERVGHVGENRNGTNEGNEESEAAAGSTENQTVVEFEKRAEVETVDVYDEDRTDGKHPDDREAGELSGEEFGAGRGDKDDEDTDSDDDDVQVTIGDIKSAPSYGYGGAPVNLNIKRGTGYASGLPGLPSSAKTKGIDLDAVGSINGVPTYEFNLDTLEDKPWRKPGADITDYFNYGFNEDSWKAYCEKQRKLRVETSAGVVKVHPHGHLVKDQQIPVATVNENSKYAGRTPASAGPPPGRKSSGCIDVIGGSTTTSRRPLNLSPKENVIQVMTADKRDYGRKPFEGMPPPPGLQPHLGPPPGFIPPDLSIPPPGIPASMLPPGLPPPGLPPPHPESLAGFPDHFGSFGRGYLQPPMGPSMDRVPHGYDSHGFPYVPGQAAYNPFEPTGGEPPWDPLDRPGREQYNPNWDFPVSERSMDKSPPHSPGHEDDPERRQGGRDRRDRERFRDRERDRERERTVDRDRERERDRDRDYEYDERRERERDRRHREHRDRDKEHRSSRRKHREDAEDSEHGRSRHKRKRIKREKEDESAGGGSETQDAAAPETAPPERQQETTA